jgi:hypothetical protein
MKDHPSDKEMKGAVRTEDGLQVTDSQKPRLSVLQLYNCKEANSANNLIEE